MRLYDKSKPCLYQYDSDQKLCCDGCKIGEEIHFENSFYSKAEIRNTYEFEGQVVADIPNHYLLWSGDLIVYRVITDDQGRSTQEKHIFPIAKRKKPADYVSTENEIVTVKGYVEKALEEAKDSGIFDGSDGLTPYIGENGNWWTGETDTGVKAEGKTPEKGVDYFTEADKAEMKSYVDDAILGGVW